MKVKIKAPKISAQFKVERVYPGLEDLEVMPSGIEQNFKSSKYGYDNVKVRAVKSDILDIAPKEEKQQYIGLFGTVNVDKIPTEYVNAVNMFSRHIEGTETEYVLPDIIEKIYNNTFQSRKIEKFVANNIKEIGSNAFAYCYINNENFSLDFSKVERILDGAFTTCDIEKVSLYKCVKFIGNRVFFSCNKLKTVYVDVPNLRQLGSYGRAMFAYSSNITSLTFGENCNSLHENMFAGITALTEVNIPNTIKELGDWVFSVCTNLKKIYIPASLSYIGADVFERDEKLEFVTIENGFNADNLDLSPSSLYSVETIVAWLNALKDRTGEEPYTLTIGITNLNKLTDEQKAIAINKNWNLA